MAAMELKVVRQLEDVAPAVWNRLAGNDNPFLRHEFLVALERHGAVSPDTGWTPHHLVLYDGDTAVAAAPAYLKAHSWGEFVFDFSWANAYSRHGLDYYPKLVMAVPFTPVTGPRLLTAPGLPAATLRQDLAEGARTLVAHAGLSSAHWLFPTAEQAAELEAAGYAIRLGAQYHWTNPGYADFEEFLAGLTAKKRKNIRRERRRVAEADVRCRIVHGDEATPDLWHAMHRFYCDTFRAHGNPPLLSEDFFREIGRTLGRGVVLVVAEHAGHPIAGAICLRGTDTLFGRYWGCDAEVPDLHFEACYYQGIEYCIGEGLHRFEPGAQGEHKVARGFLPTATYSAHHLVDSRFRAAVEDFLGRERRAVEHYVRELTMDGPYRADMLERLLR